MRLPDVTLDAQPRDLSEVRIECDRHEWIAPRPVRVHCTAGSWPPDIERNGAEVERHRAPAQRMLGGVAGLAERGVRVLSEVQALDQRPQSHEVRPHEVHLAEGDVANGAGLEVVPIAGRSV